MSELTTDFKFRTEDIKSEDLRNLFVSTIEDRKTIDMLKGPSPVIVEGSRGTGKSFLMRVAELELDEDFDITRVLPIYMTFVKSSLIHTTDPQQFQHWMLAKICTRVLRSLRSRGLVLPASPALSLLSGNVGTENASKLESLVADYENSYKKPGENIDASSVPEIDDFKDAIEDICREHKISRICLLFDEAIHIFRPEQQRQFFTIFRDLRSPFISCNAAVYPGVTSYGDVFEMTHDATLRRIEREILEDKYVDHMKEIVLRQAQTNTALMTAMSKNGANFATLAYCVSGNPRLLLKTVAQCPNLRTSEVNDVIRNFYRSTIWSEHSGLAASYKGHEPLIAWGRNFIENDVLPQTKAKNDKRSSEGQNESTCYFWIHKDSPETVKHALRLLAYTGIVEKGAEGIRGTRSELGTRYAVNFGCLLSLEGTPLAIGLDLAKNLSIRRFSEYGANHAAFDSIRNLTVGIGGSDTAEILKVQLDSSIDELDITLHQNQELKRIGINSIAQVLKADEALFIERMAYVGPVRARKIKNTADNAVLEYLSG